MYYEKNPMFADAGFGAGESWSTPIFQPDVMVPAQFFDQMRRRHLDPIRSLLLAVLEEGITDYQRAAARQDQVLSVPVKRRDAAAKAWIDGAEAPLTFDACCEALDINPDWLRKGVMAKTGPFKFKRQHIVKGPRTLKVLKPPYPVIDMEKFQQAVEMHRDGARINEIAAAVGRKRRTIQRWLSKPISGLNGQNIRRRTEGDGEIAGLAAQPGGGTIDDEGALPGDRSGVQEAT